MPAPALAPRQADAVWLAQLTQRSEQLLRVLLSAMANARDLGQADHARCFDRALRELHSLQRQVAYHSARMDEPGLVASERERLARALVLSGARLDYVAQSTARCSDEGVRVGHGQTRVETTFER